jgi:hypothetical protein
LLQPAQMSLGSTAFDAVHASAAAFDKLYGSGAQAAPGALVSSEPTDDPQAAPGAAP